MKQLRDFVIRFSRRIVARASEELIGTRRLDAIQARMATGDHENDRRHRHLAPLQHERFDMTRQMVHGNDRDAARPRKRLCEGKPDEQRSH